MMAMSFRLAAIWKALVKQSHRYALPCQVTKILQRVDAMPTIDNHSPDEILGYDEHGLAR